MASGLLLGVVFFRDPIIQESSPVQEVGDLLKIGSGASSRGHGRGADADAARGEGRHVAVHCVAVQRDGALLAHLLHLATAQAVGAQVPKDEVVVRAVARELVALGHQGLGQGIRIGLDLLGVFLELRSGDLQQLRSQAADLVVVGSTLQSREDGHVNPVLDVRHLLAVLEEDHACPGAPKGLVCGCGHDVAEGEGRRMLTGGHQARDVGDIRHEEGANLVSDLPELREVHHSRVRGGTAEDHGRPEDQSGLAKLVEVNESRLRVDTVWQRLEVDGRGLGNLETGQIPTPRPIVYPRSRDAPVYINLGKEEKGQAGLGHEMAVGDVGWGSAARICKGRIGVTRTAWAVIRRKRVHNPNRRWAAVLLLLSTDDPFTYVHVSGIALAIVGVIYLFAPRQTPGASATTNTCAALLFSYK